MKGAIKQLLAFIMQLHKTKFNIEVHDQNEEKSYEF